MSDEKLTDDELEVLLQGFESQMDWEQYLPDNKWYANHIGQAYTAAWELKQMRTDKEKREPVEMPVIDETTNAWARTLNSIVKHVAELETENADLRQQLAYYAGGDGKGLER